MSSESIRYTNKDLQKSLLSILFILLTIAAYAADVCVDNLSTGSDVSWTIINKEGHVEYASDDFLGSEQCYMEFADNEQFQWHLVVNETISTDTVLMTLSVDGNVILAVPNTVSLGDHSSSFVTGVKTPVMKIVGGSNASIKDFPWQVFFTFGNYMCGGTIIADRWILTAAHCTQDDNGVPISTSEMSVLVGATNRISGSGKSYSVKRYVIHENYNNETLSNDIAVLELDEQIDYPNAEIISLISATDVANGATDPGVMSTVTGWGYTDAKEQQVSTVLQQVELPLVDNNVASDVWGYLKPSILSAGYKNGNKDACSGDSGGPLVVDVNGEYKIAGIVSFGSERCNTYGGYTRVSSFLSWIEEQTLVVPFGELAFVSGETMVCYGTEASTYNVSNGGTDYVWELSPASAGALNYMGNSATVTWDDAYVGDVELRVKAEINDYVTVWKYIMPTVLPVTKLLSFSSDTIICEGDYISMEAEAEGDNLEYEWYKDEYYIKTTEEGRYIIDAADTLSSANYKCFIKGTCGEVVTQNMSLTVWPNTKVTAQSALDVDVMQGGNAQLSVSAVGHQLSYQWYKDSRIINEATNTTLSLTDVNALDIGDYYAVVTGSCQTDTSAQVYVYVDDQSLLYNARIWPSVCDDVLNVAVSTDFSFDVYLYDINGLLKLESTDNKHSISIDVSTYPEGIYALRVESESLNEVFRFVKR